MKKITYLLVLFTAVTVSAKAQTDMQKTPKGTLYLNYTHLPGDKIKANDVITFNMIQKTDKDSVLNSTYTTGQPFKTQVREQDPLSDVFIQMTAKDSVMVKVPTDSIFVGHEDQRPKFFPKGSYLIFIVKVEKVQTLQDAIAERDAAAAKLKADEATLAAKYITDHKLTLTTTPSGLKYQVIQATQKRKVIKGDTVMVNYTGRLLDDKVFDSSVAAEATKAKLDQPGRTYEPIQVVVGAQQVIPGWEEGLALLHEGEKAKFVIPSSIGYGAQGYGSIPGYSTLVFDIEVVKVKPAKHVAAPVKKTTTIKKTGAKKAVTKKG